MRALVQRVRQASVQVADEIVGRINHGLLVLLGIHKDDTPAQVTWLVNKIVTLRVFADEQGKMNRSVLDVGGSILVVSQFTLYGTCDKGRRPEFTQAASGPEANALYEAFVSQMRRQVSSVATGRFGEYMLISSVNDGPVTLLVEQKSSSR